MKRLLLLAFLISGASYGQTTVWSCQSNCSATSNTYNDGSWRVVLPAPNFVAATIGTDTACTTRNYWNVPGSVRWRRVADLSGAHCVAIKTGNVESFVAASTFGWPPVTPPVDPPPPPPPPSTSVVISITPQQVFTGQPVTVTWTSENALACFSSWAPDVPFNGSQSLTLTLPNADARAWVQCNGVGNTYRAEAGYRVLAKTPKVLPHVGDFIALPGRMAKVQWDWLETTGTPYTFKVTYFWRDEAGVIHNEAWAVTKDSPIRYAVREQNGGRYDETEARGQCESECIHLPDGPLKTEIDAFRARFTVDQLGIVGE